MGKSGRHDSNNKNFQESGVPLYSGSMLLEKNGLHSREPGDKRLSGSSPANRSVAEDDSLSDSAAPVDRKTGNRFHQKLLQILRPSDSFIVVTHTGGWTCKMKGLRTGSAYPRISREGPPIRREESMASAPNQVNYIFNFVQKDGSLNRDARALNRFNCEIYSLFSEAYERSGLVFPKKLFSDLFRKTAFFRTVDCGRVMGALARNLLVDPGAEAIFCLHAEVPDSAAEDLLECLSMKLVQAATQSAQICRNTYGGKPSRDLGSLIKRHRPWARSSPGVLDYRLNVTEG